MITSIRKALLLVPLLFLVACGPVTSSIGGGSSSVTDSSSITESQSIVTSSTMTSGSASTSSSATSSSSGDPALERYFGALLADTPLTLVRHLLTVSKDTTVYKTISHREEIDLAHSIERVYESKTIVAGFEDNDDYVTSTSEVYTTPEWIYTRGNDNKYHLSAPTATPVFAAYHLPYDFAQASEITFSYQGFKALLGGKVSADHLAAFTKSEKLDGVTDFSFEATLGKTEGTPKLEAFVFSYTQESYEVKISFTVSSDPLSITLPTIG